MNDQVPQPNQPNLDPIDKMIVEQLDPGTIAPDIRQAIISRLRAKAEKTPEEFSDAEARYGMLLVRAQRSSGMNKRAGKVAGPEPSLAEL